MGQKLSVDSTSGHLVLTPSPTCMEQVGEAECGHCVQIVSGTESFIGEKAPHLLGGKPWSKIRNQSVYLPAQESYAPLAAYIINQCHKAGCSDDVDRFRVKINSLIGLKGVAGAVESP